ncbi:hypothetical protein [Actinomyces respiraculi]|uniref:hypothetical protein n=1 Tax=Actinomyces respiraculi TaxID=2744574 RepID=UPI0014201309|nr:hypothetical protein [Actinomyces respiraculi]
MKPQPRRRPTPPIPKATGPDPANLNASIRNNAGVETNASVQPNAGRPTARHTTTVKKMTLRLDEHDLGRIRAAWINDLAHGGHCPSLNAWIVELIMDQVEATEQARNDGAPYAPIPAGQIPTGRPHALE